jgi:hypothetical protein
LLNGCQIDLASMASGAGKTATSGNVVVLASCFTFFWRRAGDVTDVADGVSEDATLASRVIACCAF